MELFETQNEYGKGTVRNWASILDAQTRAQAEMISRSPIVSEPVALMPDAHFGIGACVGSAITHGLIEVLVEKYERRLMPEFVMSSRKGDILVATGNGANGQPHIFVEDETAMMVRDLWPRPSFGPHIMPLGSLLRTEVLP